MKKTFTFVCTFWQLLTVTILIFLAVALLLVHLFNPAIDYTRTALFVLSIIVPVLLPTSCFPVIDSESDVNNGFLMLGILFYGYIMVWLGATNVTSFIFCNLTKYSIFGIIPILAGSGLFQGIYLSFHHENNFWEISKKDKLRKI